MPNDPSNAPPKEIYAWIADGQDSPMGVWIGNERFAAVTTKPNKIGWFKDLIKAKVSDKGVPIRLYKFKLDGQPIETIDLA